MAKEEIRKTMKAINSAIVRLEIAREALREADKALGDYERADTFDAVTTVYGGRR